MTTHTRTLRRVHPGLRLTTSSTALDAPIALQEMVLAFWLIAKGFNAQPSPRAPSAP